MNVTVLLGGDISLVSALVLKKNATCGFTVNVPFEVIMNQHYYVLQ